MAAVGAEVGVTPGGNSIGGGVICALGSEV